MIRASLIEGGGTIAVLATGADDDPFSPFDRVPSGPFAVRAWQPDNLVTIAARRMLDGHKIALFDERGLSGTAMTRITDIADALRDMERRARAFEWKHCAVPGLKIRDERDAIAWFMQSAADILFVGIVAFEKQASARDGDGARRPRRSLTPRSTPRAA